MSAPTTFFGRMQQLEKADQAVEKELKRLNEEYSGLIVGLIALSFNPKDFLLDLRHRQSREDWLGTCKTLAAAMNWPYLTKVPDPVFDQEVERLRKKSQPTTPASRRKSAVRTVSRCCCASRRRRTSPKGPSPSPAPSACTPSAASARRCAAEPPYHHTTVARW